MTGRQTDRPTDQQINQPTNQPINQANRIVGYEGSWGSYTSNNVAMFSNSEATYSDQ